jgi:hypothetical protein
MPNVIGIFIRPSKKYLGWSPGKPRRDQITNRQVVSRCTDGRQEDILTPGQYYDEIAESSKWTRAFTKYRELWTACLFDAYRTLQSGPTRHRIAEQKWFKSKANRVGSFLWICRHLNLDSEAIRKEVLK